MSGQQHRASRCVFVGNIPYDATEEQLVQICEEVGPVVSFRLVVDRDTGKPKGYGFCEFRDEETALSARRNLQGYEINGRQLRVDFAENEKGGGGVDRNRDQQQGRGGPGFQQSAANIDALKHGGLGAPQHYGIAGGPGALEQPMGRAAASAAAAMMAGALGGAQQMPNMMLPPQAPLQTMTAPPPLGPGNGAVAGTDALTSHLAGMSKYQLYEIMSQMKIMIQQNQQQARQILVSNPQLTKALFQAQIMLGMVRPQQGVPTQQPQGQTTLPQQPANMMPQQQPRPPQPHVPPPAQLQPQGGGKSTFQPPLPQAPQLQQQQAQQPQQQQPQPHGPQGGFQQGGMVQTSMGMPFQPGQPPPPSQPPPQQMYQMGASMVTMNMPRMVTTSSGGPVGLGNGGLAGGAGPMGPGAGQLGRGPGLTGGAIDNRGVQLNQGPPASVSASGVSGGHGQPPMPGAGPMTSGHPMPSASGGMVGMGGALPSTMSTPQMIGDARGYSGQGMNVPMNQGINGLNPNMNLGMSSGMNQAMNMSMSAPQTGGFVGPADGTTVTSTAMQPQPYSQVQMQMASVPQQSQVPLELEQQKALLQQVMNLTNEQIMSLPPEQRQQVLQLQQALR